MDFLVIYSLIFVFAIGAAIGSFLNVVIYRVPAGLSVVSPPSRCPVCETQISWYDNIPIFSWFILRGKCRSCGTAVSPRYAMVEVLTAVVGTVLWWQRMAPVVDSGQVTEEALLWIAVPWAFYFVFACLLIVITFIDLDHFLIPHEFTFPGMAIGLASPWVFDAMFGEQYIFYSWPPITPFVSLIGFLSGGLIIILIFYVYLAARGIEGMGGGDVTLMAMVGAWLGWPSVIFVLFASSLQGLIAAGVATLLGADFVKDSTEIFDEDEEEEGEEDEADETATAEASGESSEVENAEGDEEGDEMEGKAAIPFGPFISLAALEYLIFGPWLPQDLSMIQFFY